MECPRNMPVKNKNTSALFKEHAECESLTRVVRFTKHQTKQPLGSLTQSLFFVLPDDDEADFVKSGSMDLLDSSLLIVKGLKRNTEYVMQIVAVNDDGSTKGPNQREKTLGGGKQHIFILSV